MDNNTYRLVPNRFLIDESNSDLCKLTKLTNLFPEMKPLIELELFKINNLQRIVARLSQIYTVLSGVDNRDDTLHLFLGPFHISLGPAIFGAMHFKNISAALLATSGSRGRSESVSAGSHRRREAVLRRFRRSVRKLIFIKSVIDQIQLASILTPYNQYALYKHGIYDLVLAGQISNSSSLFNDSRFIEQMNNVNSTNTTDKENALFSSKYVKINSLLNLLSTNTSQNQQDIMSSMSMMGNRTQGLSDNPISVGTEENHSTGICCSQHSDTQQNALVPIRRLSIYASNPLLSSEYQSSLGSMHGLSKSSRDSLSQTHTTSTTSRLAVDNSSKTNVTKNKSTKLSSHTSSPSKQSINTTVSDPFISSSESDSTEQETVLINNISSLLIDYLASRQTKSVPTDVGEIQNVPEEPSILAKPTNRTVASTVASTESMISSQSSPLGQNDDFDKILQRVKKLVDSHLSASIVAFNQVHQGSNQDLDVPYTPDANSTHENRRSLFKNSGASFYGKSVDETSNSTPSKKSKLSSLFKTQSLDETGLDISSTNLEPNEPSTVL